MSFPSSWTTLTTWWLWCDPFFLLRIWVDIDDLYAVTYFSCLCLWCIHFMIFNLFILIYWYNKNWRRKLNNHKWCFCFVPKLSQPRLTRKDGKLVWECWQYSLYSTVLITLLGEIWTSVKVWHQSNSLGTVCKQYWLVLQRATYIFTQLVTPTYLPTYL